MGTSVGTKVFLENGWRANAGLNTAWAGFQLLVLVLRGPHCARYTWFGYQGGFAWRKERKRDVDSSPNVEDQLEEDTKASPESEEKA
jgi:hypothetical protein